MEEAHVRGFRVSRATAVTLTTNGQSCSTTADRRDDLEVVCRPRGIEFLGLVENVVMDEKDRDEISYRLAWLPHLIETPTSVG